MGRDSFDDNIRQFDVAIAACEKIRAITPILVLLYSLVDAMAWLCRPDDHPDVTRKDSEDWVARYVLPHPKLPCTPTDLYAARCGLLHSHSPESRKAREGDARKICYAWGARNEAEIRYRLDFSASGVLAIHLNALRDAVVGGIRKMQEEMDKDTALAARVLRRSDKIFASVRQMPSLPKPRS